MTSPTPPALTPDEWAGIPEYADGENLVTFWSEVRPEVFMGPAGKQTLVERPHALAALALYGQSFGFDATDVEFLRGFADLDLMTDEQLRYMESLASRLQALLPPDPAI